MALDAFFLKSNLRLMSDDVDKSQVEVETELLPAHNQKQIDLYRFGIDTIISGTIQFVAPFHLLSKQVLVQTENGIEPRKYSATLCKADFDWFLSRFFFFSTDFIQVVSERFAETIRRNTIRSDIRGQTTMSLAKSIRAESFGDVELALKNYVTIANGLGITLANTSKIKNSIGGAFVGGGLDFLVTDGTNTSVGAVAGAIIGGALAEVKKSNLRTNMSLLAIENVKTITSLIGITPIKLMDQYVSLMFGEQTDFARRDKEIEYGKRITTLISSSCISIFDEFMILLHRLKILSQLEITSCSVFEIPLLPKKRRQEEITIKEVIEKLLGWHNYVEQLQTNCKIGIMSEARFT